MATHNDITTHNEITVERINQLLVFLPLLDVPERSFAHWKTINDEGETLSLPYFVYDEDVERFFRCAAQSWWIDDDYLPRTAAAMLDDIKIIEAANLDEIKIMLTYCVRVEKFYDGGRETLLKEGKIVALLKRLSKLKLTL